MCFYFFFCLCLFHVFIFSILILSIFIFFYLYAFIYLFIFFLFSFQKNSSFLVGTRDLRTLWSPPISLNQERHTQRHKAANFIFILFIFCDENPLKSPSWKHTWWSEHFRKFPKQKTKSPHFQEGKKKVLKLPHFEEKKNRFWNRWDLWRIWANSKLSSFETCLWRAC